MKKKILLVDDSALMRRVFYDIITENEEFVVEDTATNGKEALELLKRKSYHCVILDVNMPKMSGIELLKELNANKINVNVVMNSTVTKEGARITIEALELGAFDFVHKPESILRAKDNSFKETFMAILTEACKSRFRTTGKNLRSTLEKADIKPDQAKAEQVNHVLKKSVKVSGEKIVAIASSTGGPRALAELVPRLPKNLNAPVVIVQHMPSGFTASLADRLNSLSEITVKEAVHGEELKKGYVYISKGGMHLKIRQDRRKNVIEYSDEPPREGVKPCANYMYESLSTSMYKQIVCVVMTGMGSDGTKGINKLLVTKNVHVIAQDEQTCTVYGMPRAIAMSGVVNEVVPLEKIATKITENVGVN